MINAPGDCHKHAKVNSLVKGDNSSEEHESWIRFKNHYGSGDDYISDEEESEDKDDDQDYVPENLPKKRFKFFHY